MPGGFITTGGRGNGYHRVQPGLWPADRRHGGYAEYDWLNAVTLRSDAEKIKSVPLPARNAVPVSSSRFMWNN